MDDGNPHLALFSNEMGGKNLPRDAGFTFVDFLPGITQRRRYFKPATFENFGTLVGRANDFLRTNRKWKIVTCESVEFKTKQGDQFDPLKMAYTEYGSAATSYIRGLRLWLTEKKDETEREQQIGYMNLIPEQLDKPGMFKRGAFETLDTVIEKYNTMQHAYRVPGRIITIETQKMNVDKVTSFHKFDPDRSHWQEIGNLIVTYVIVFRIFYEITDDYLEDIGIKDFIPEIISERGCCSLPQYEAFSKVVNEASAWCDQHRNLRFCNAQTLEIIIRKGSNVDTNRMDYTVNGSLHESYVRILRVAYTKISGIDNLNSENRLPIRRLASRIFFPLEVTTGKYINDYENLTVTRERISAWIKATGARVLSAETVAYRIKSGGEKTQGPEASFTWGAGELNEHYMFAVRLYLDGVYAEPSPEMLPPLPEVIIEKSCCQVS